MSISIQNQELLSIEYEKTTTLIKKGQYIDYFRFSYKTLITLNVFHISQQFA